MANRLSHYLHGAGYRKGDSVAVCLENRLEYTAVWMGCAKIGVVPALININIRGKVLAHKLEVAKAKGIIFSNEMEGSEFYSLRNFKAVCFRVLAGEVFSVCFSFSATRRSRKDEGSCHKCTMFMSGPMCQSTTCKTFELFVRLLGS